MSALAWSPAVERVAPQVPQRARLTVLPPVEEAPLPSLRITRRGRLAMTLLAFGAISLLALVLAARMAAPAPTVEHVAVIQAGQTLSDVAREELPHLPIGVAVTRIQVANAMNSSSVVQGQSLLIPAS
ncbi:LysM peptidoglycan-binding domain-containing protein [Gephyromycinifex aptenodytis]|uniref:LysM peptidoglycan-binding domain-containing protein n=1 Tax=Gephyromycinifex aptenodytis TaxID=2716227 RepID=UPI001447C266|nr:LysM peptidoglycan-binding domain-containing protein [Gephyromycinifex aptenodytis]